MSKLTKHTNVQNYAKSVGTRLTDVGSSVATGYAGVKLTSNRNSSRKFAITIDHALQNNYRFKDMKSGDIKRFSEFLTETVGKGCTISQVDHLFLRTKGNPGRKEQVNGTEVKMVHYGKNRAPFRVFGYYNEDGYFVVHRIDPHHLYDN